MYVDYAAGEAAFDFAVMTLRHSSVEENDMVLRVLEVLSLIWRMQGEDQNLETESPTLVIKCHLGASLIFDGLLRWRELQLKLREARIVPNNPNGKNLSKDPYLQAN